MPLYSNTLVFNSILVINLVVLSQVKYSRKVGIVWRGKKPLTFTPTDKVF